MVDVDACHCQLASRLFNWKYFAEDDDEESSSDEDEASDGDKEPRLHAAVIAHHGIVNRIKLCIA